jgi:hypothetical protein
MKDGEFIQPHLEEAEYLPLDDELQSLENAEFLIIPREEARERALVGISAAYFVVKTAKEDHSYLVVQKERQRALRRDAAKLHRNINALLEKYGANDLITAPVPGNRVQGWHPGYDVFKKWCVTDDPLFAQAEGIGCTSIEYRVQERRFFPDVPFAVLEAALDACDPVLKSPRSRVRPTWNSRKAELEPRKLR